ncbi:hypothetical protein IJG14_05215 [bacterium]|nr:hypothetical protein [bacterium]
MFGKIKLNKTILYFWGLTGIISIFTIILSFYCNAATQMNDGWLDIYSQNILKGIFLYKDYNFPLLPFPIYFYTTIIKFFGQKMIVGHIAGAVLKICILGVFYTILQKFFGHRNAFWGTIVTGSVLIAIIFDCCIFSYNDLMYLLGLIVTLLLIIETEKLCENK